MPPSDEVPAHFEVRLAASLGGRVNQNWLVEAHGEQFVLRCWEKMP